MSEEGNSITYQINVITITKCALYKWLNWSYIYIYNKKWEKRKGT